jgi:hypothetical protein
VSKDIQPGTIAYAALPNWVKEAIKKQQKEYVEYFEEKWKEGLDPILYDLPISEDDKLPDSILELLDISEPGSRFKFVLQGGQRVIGIATHLGPVALYEVDLDTKVPMDEKYTKFALCKLRNLKLHAAEIFWQSQLLELNHKGGVSVITFMYAFGLSALNNPGSTPEVLNANTIDKKVARLHAAFESRRK